MRARTRRTISRAFPRFFQRVGENRSHLTPDPASDTPAGTRIRGARSNVYTCVSGEQNANFRLSLRSRPRLQGGSKASVSPPSTNRWWSVRERGIGEKGRGGGERLKSIRCIHAGIPSRYIMYLLSGKGNPPRISPTP